VVVYLFVFLQRYESSVYSRSLQIQVVFQKICDANNNRYIKFTFVNKNKHRTLLPSLFLSWHTGKEKWDNFIVVFQADKHLKAFCVAFFYINFGYV
jgi:hypothetical protein